MSDSALHDALQDLAEFAEAARPYLPQMVLVGGWVPYFYRYLPAVSAPTHDPILTLDFDLATPDRLVQSGGRPLDKLLTSSEFTVIRAMDPPIPRYQHLRRGDKDLAPVHFEFLASLTGPEADQRGESNALREIQPGLQAQRLRYLELLLHEPLEMSTERVPDLLVTPPVVLRIPNPASYLIQKGLIHGRRRPERAEKDSAYVHEVALLWSGQEPEVRTMLDSLAGCFPLWARWVARGRSELARGFSSETSDGPVSVERELASARVSPAVTARAAFRVVRPFLEKALGVRSLPKS